MINLQELVKSSDEDKVELRMKRSLATLSNIMLASKNFAVMVVSVAFMERSLKSKRGLEDLMLSYKEVQKDRQKKHSLQSSVAF